MNFISLHELSQKQKNDITNLIKICEKYEPISLSFPLSNEENFDTSLDCYYLCYVDQKLISALGVILPDRSICECVAFTDPNFRKQGLFADLLRQAQSDLEKYKEMDFVLLSDHKSKDTTSAFDVLGVEYWYSEFMMASKIPDLIFHRSSTNVSLISIREAGFLNEEDHNAGMVYHAILEGLSIGFCCVISYDSYAYLYALEISEPYRGQGYGKAFIIGILSMLAKTQVEEVRLQVRSQNEAAFHIYRQLGFSILEKLSYYLA